jgi:bifunctional non-homologous end joining protein LigD
MRASTRRSASRPVGGLSGRPGGDTYAPMLASPGELPDDDVRWAFELKWDGMRVVASAERRDTRHPAMVRLRTRNGRDVADSYPELAPLGAVLATHGAVVDGEIVALDAEGRPDFGRLQRRLRLSGERARLTAVEVPVVYLVFDLLELDGEPLCDQPYHLRRRRLEELADEGHGPMSGPAWAVPPVFERGREALALAERRGFEGVVAKRLDSRYVPGQRSHLWRKVVLVNRESFVVGGWRAGEGARRQTLSALLTGRYDADGDLRYTGAVGSGLSQNDLAYLQAEATRLAVDSSPFSGRQPQGNVYFMRPELVIDVAFRERTSSGTLRHPRFEGLRPDLSPDTVRDADEG